MLASISSRGPCIMNIIMLFVQVMLFLFWVICLSGVVLFLLYIDIRSPVREGLGYLFVFGGCTERYSFLSYLPCMPTVNTLLIAVCLCHICFHSTPAEIYGVLLPEIECPFLLILLSSEVLSHAMAFR